MARPRTSYDDRRSDVRLEGGGAVDAVVLDAHQFPVRTLQSPRVDNVSASGMAILTLSEGVEIGSRVRVTLAGTDAVEVPGVVLEVMSVAAQPDGRFALHCRVLEGTVPAALIFRW
jgi:hypothetical protein